MRTGKLILVFFILLLLVASVLAANWQATIPPPKKAQLQVYQIGSAAGHSFFFHLESGFGEIQGSRILNEPRAWNGVKKLGKGSEHNGKHTLGTLKIQQQIKTRLEGRELLRDEIVTYKILTNRKRTKIYLQPTEPLTAVKPSSGYPVLKTQIDEGLFNDLDEMSLAETQRIYDEFLEGEERKILQRGNFQVVEKQGGGYCIGALPVIDDGTYYTVADHVPQLPDESPVQIATGTTIEGEPCLNMFLFYTNNEDSDRTFYALPVTELNTLRFWSTKLGREISIPMPEKLVSELFEALYAVFKNEEMIPAHTDFMIKDGKATLRYRGAPLEGISDESTFYALIREQLKPVTLETAQPGICDPDFEEANISLGPGLIGTFFTTDKQPKGRVLLANTEGASVLLPFILPYYCGDGAADASTPVLTSEDCNGVKKAVASMDANGAWTASIDPQSQECTDNKCTFTFKIDKEAVTEKAPLCIIGFSQKGIRSGKLGEESGDLRWLAPCSKLVGEGVTLDITFDSAINGVAYLYPLDNNEFKWRVCDENDDDTYKAFEEKIGSEGEDFADYAYRGDYLYQDSTRGEYTAGRGGARAEYTFSTAARKASSAVETERTNMGDNCYSKLDKQGPVEDWLACLGSIAKLLRGNDDLKEEDFPKKKELKKELHPENDHPPYVETYNNLVTGPFEAARKSAKKGKTKEARNFLKTVIGEANRISARIKREKEGKEPDLSVTNKYCRAGMLGPDFGECLYRNVELMAAVLEQGGTIDKTKYYRLECSTFYKSECETYLAQLENPNLETLQGVLESLKPQLVKVERELVHYKNTPLKTEANGLAIGTNYQLKGITQNDVETELHLTAKTQKITVKSDTKPVNIEWGDKVARFLGGWQATFIRGVQQDSQYVDMIVEGPVVRYNLEEPLQKWAEKESAATTAFEVKSEKDQPDGQLLKICYSNSGNMLDCDDGMLIRSMVSYNGERTPINIPASITTRMHLPEVDTHHGWGVYPLTIITQAFSENANPATKSFTVEPTHLSFKDNEVKEIRGAIYKIPRPTNDANFYLFSSLIRPWYSVADTHKEGTLIRVQYDKNEGWGYKFSTDDLDGKTSLENFAVKRLGILQITIKSSTDGDFAVKLGRGEDSDMSKEFRELGSNSILIAYIDFSGQNVKGKLQGGAITDVTGYAAVEQGATQRAGLFMAEHDRLGLDQKRTWIADDILFTAESTYDSFAYQGGALPMVDTADGAQLVLQEGAIGFTDTFIAGDRVRVLDCAIDGSDCGPMEGFREDMWFHDVRAEKRVRKPLELMNYDHVDLYSRFTPESVATVQSYGGVFGLFGDECYIPDTIEREHPQLIGDPETSDYCIKTEGTQGQGDCIEACSNAYGPGGAAGYMSEHYTSCKTDCERHYGVVAQCCNRQGGSDECNDAMQDTLALHGGTADDACENNQAGRACSFCPYGCSVMQAGGDPCRPRIT